MLGRRGRIPLNPRARAPEASEPESVRESEAHDLEFFARQPSAQSQPADSAYARKRRSSSPPKTYCCFRFAIRCRVTLRLGLALKMPTGAGGQGGNIRRVHRVLCPTRYSDSVSRSHDPLPSPTHHDHIYLYPSSPGSSPSSCLRRVVLESARALGL